MKKFLIVTGLLLFVATPCFADYFSNSRGSSLNSTSSGTTLYTRQQLENDRDEEMRRQKVDYEKVNEYNRQIDMYNQQRNIYHNSDYNFHKNFNRIN